MGKAKRFNAYDGIVNQNRQIAEQYGRDRQNLAGIGSSFRNMPQTPPTSRKNPVPEGAGTGKFLTVSLAADQTANIAANDHVEFDTKDEDGKIVLQTGSGQADGIFELESGKKYELSAMLRPEFSGATGQLVIAWYDITNSAEIGSRAIYEAQTHASHNANQPVAEAIVTPAANITAEVRIIAVTALTALANEYCIANLFEIALGGTIAGVGGVVAAGDDLGNHTATQDLAMATFDIDDGGVIFLNEQASADADVAGDGQIWVKTATPNQLFFTDDAGTDHQLGVGSQTPLLADVDADGFDIKDLSNIEFRNTTGTPASSVSYINNDSTGDMSLNVASGDSFFFGVDQVAIAQFAMDEIDFRSTQQNGPDLDLRSIDTGIADNERVARILWSGFDDGGSTKFTWGSIHFEYNDASAGAKQGLMDIRCQSDNALVQILGYVGSTAAMIVAGGVDVFRPNRDDGIDLGSSSQQWKDFWVDGTATIDTLQIDLTSTFTGQANFNGDVNLGDATGDTISFTGRIDTDVFPSSNNTRSLGDINAKWKDVFAVSYRFGIADALITSDAIGMGIRVPTGDNIDFEVNDVSQAAISAGNFTFKDGFDFVLGTTTGTKIGTSSTQKLGFFGATPVVQSAAYSVTNLTTDRSYDADSTTTAELADVLGTLLADLVTIGIIG